MEYFPPEFLVLTLVHDKLSFSSSLKMYRHGISIEKFFISFIFQTFIVITSRFGKRHVHVLNKAKSFYIFGQNHPVRKFALYITTNQYPLIQKKDKGQQKNVRIEFCQQVTEALII